MKENTITVPITGPDKIYNVEITLPDDPAKAKAVREYYAQSEAFDDMNRMNRLMAPETFEEYARWSISEIEKNKELFTSIFAHPSMDVLKSFVDMSRDNMEKVLGYVHEDFRRRYETLMTEVIEELENCESLEEFFAIYLGMTARMKLEFPEVNQ